MDGPDELRSLAARNDGDTTAALRARLEELEAAARIPRFSRT